MEKLVYETGLKVTNEEGKVTADVKIVLPEMKLIDVVELQIAQLKAILTRLEEQRAQLLSQQ